MQRSHDLGHAPLPAQSEVIGVVNRLSRPQRRRGLRGRLDARRPAQAVAHPRPQGLPRRVRLLLHGLRDRRRARASRWPSLDAGEDRDVVRHGRRRLLPDDGAGARHRRPGGREAHRRPGAEPRLRLDRRAVGVAGLAAVRHPLPLPHRHRASTATCCRSTWPPTPPASAPHVHPGRGPRRVREGDRRGAGSRTSRPWSTSRPTRSCRRPTAPPGGTSRSPRSRRSTAPGPPGRRTRQHKARQRSPPDARRPTRDREPRRTKLMRTIEHWIAGKHVSGTGGAHRPTSATRPLGAQQAAGACSPAREDVDAAVQAATRRLRRRGAQASVTARARRCMFAFRELLSSTNSTSPRSSPPSTARRSTTPAARCVRGREVVEFACGIPQLLKGEFSDQVSGGRRLALVPPAARRRAPASRRSTSRSWCRCGCIPVAIACGNTFVLKPSERDPSALLILVAELYAEAGLPDGVFNVVHGDKVAVDALLDHPDIGGGLVRRLDPDREVRPRAGDRARASGCRRSAAPRTTPIIMPDADLDFAADQLVAAGYGSAGQRCMAISAVVAVGRRRRRAGRAGQREGPRRSRSAPARRRQRDGSGRHRRSARPDRRPHRDRREPRAPRLVVDGRGLTRRRSRGRLLRRAHPDRPGHHGHGVYTRGDLRTGAVRAARRRRSTRRST